MNLLRRSRPSEIDLRGRGKPKPLQNRGFSVSKACPVALDGTSTIGRCMVSHSLKSCPVVLQHRTRSVNQKPKSEDVRNAKTPDKRLWNQRGPDAILDYPLCNGLAHAGGQHQDRVRSHKAHGAASNWLHVQSPCGREGQVGGIKSGEKARSFGLLIEKRGVQRTPSCWSELPPLMKVYDFRTASCYVLLAARNDRVWHTNRLRAKDLGIWTNRPRGQG